MSYKAQDSHKPRRTLSMTSGDDKWYTEFVASATGALGLDQSGAERLTKHFGTLINLGFCISAKLKGVENPLENQVIGLSSQDAEKLETHLRLSKAAELVFRAYLSEQKAAKSLIDGIKSQLTEALSKVPPPPRGGSELSSTPGIPITPARSDDLLDKFLLKTEKELRLIEALDRMEKQLCVVVTFTAVHFHGVARALIECTRICPVFQLPRSRVKLTPLVSTDIIVPDILWGIAADILQGQTRIGDGEPVELDLEKFPFITKISLAPQKEAEKLVATITIHAFKDDRIATAEPRLVFTTRDATKGWLTPYLVFCSSWIKQAEGVPEGSQMDAILNRDWSGMHLGLLPHLAKRSMRTPKTLSIVNAAERWREAHAPVLHKVPKMDIAALPGRLSAFQHHQMLLQRCECNVQAYPTEDRNRELMAANISQRFWELHGGYGPLALYPHNVQLLDDDVAPDYSGNRYEFTSVAGSVNKLSWIADLCNVGPVTLTEIEPKSRPVVLPEAFPTAGPLPSTAEQGQLDLWGGAPAPSRAK